MTTEEMSEFRRVLARNVTAFGDLADEMERTVAALADVPDGNVFRMCMEDGGESVAQLVYDLTTQALRTSKACANLFDSITHRDVAFRERMRQRCKRPPEE